MSKNDGLIITFYSYKGGVGRTFIMANIATLLSIWGYRVLCVDFDLEAPGLPYYFKELDNQNTPGVVELIQDYVDKKSPDWHKYTTTIKQEKAATYLTFILAGIQNDEAPFFTINNILDWEKLFYNLKQSDQPSQKHIRNLLDTKGRNIIGNWFSGKKINKKSKELIVNSFNVILKNEHFYDEVAFKEVKIINEGNKLLKKSIKSLTEEEIQDLNYLLIKSIYPEIIGNKQKAYINRLQELNWEKLYNENDLGIFIVNLRNEWKKEFDFILVDSRTGITDIGGICTIQLPDILAFAFTANHQSLQGAIGVVKSASKQRNHFVYDRANLLALPIISRFDMREEYKLADKWLKTFEKELGEFYTNWANREVQISDILAFTKVPYFSYWSFGEKLPVIEEPLNDPERISYSFQTIAALIAHQLSNTNLLIQNRDMFVNLASKADKGKTFNYDVILIYFDKDTDFIINFRDALIKHGIRVHPLPEDKMLLKNIIREQLQEVQHIVFFISNNEEIKELGEISLFTKFLFNQKIHRQIFPVLLIDNYPEKLPPDIKKMQILRANKIDLEELAYRINNVIKKNNLWINEILLFHSKCKYNEVRQRIYPHLNIVETILANIEYKDKKKTLIELFAEAKKEHLFTSLHKAIEYLWITPDKWHCVLLGDAGMGKTTSLLKLWEKLLKDNSKTPVAIFINLENYNKISEEKRKQFIWNTIFQEYLGYYPTSTEINELKNHFAEKIDINKNHPQLILLLDGFNEVITHNKDLLLCLNEIRQLESVQLIVSSRYDMRNNLNWLEFACLTLEPLRNEQIKTFILAQGMEFTEELLKNNPLLKNPMMLSLYCGNEREMKISKENKEYSFIHNAHNKAEILHNFISSSLVRLDRQTINENDKRLHRLYLKHLLPKIGYEIEITGRFEIKRNDLMHIIKEEFDRYCSDNFRNKHPDLDEAIRRLQYQLDSSNRDNLTEAIKKLTEHPYSLMKEVQNYNYMFFHQDFRDYFAAVYVKNKTEERIDSKDNTLPELSFRIFETHLINMLGELTGEPRRMPVIRDGAYHKGEIKETILDKALKLLRNEKMIDEDYRILNIMEILKEKRRDFSDTDLLALDIRNIFFNNVRLGHGNIKNKLHGANLRGSQLKSYNFFPQSSSSDVTSASYSFDGKKIISGSKDNTIKECEVDTEKCIRIYTGHSSEISSVIYSPDGKKVLSGSKDNTIKEWDIITGECVRTYKGHSYDVSSVIYSPDGKKVLSGSKDNTIKEWDIITGECVRTYKGHSSVVTSVNYSSDGKKVLSGSWDNLIKEWNVITGQCIRTYNGHSDSITCVSYSPDGEKIVSGSWDNLIKEWNVITGECIRTYKGHSDNITSASYSPDGEKIVSGSLDKTIKEWNVIIGECIRTYREPYNNISSVSYSPDGEKILLISENKIKEWNIKTGECSRIFQNVSGLLIQGVDMRDLHPNSKISEEEKKVLEQYGAIWGYSMEEIDSMSVGIKKQLYECLKGLLPAMFNEVMFLLDIDKALISGSEAPQAIRALDIINLLAQQKKGFQKLQDILKKRYGIHIEPGIINEIKKPFIGNGIEFINKLILHTEAIIKPVQSKIKFDDNEIKIDRSEILEELEKALKTSSLIILSGDAGVGKTAVIKDYYNISKETKSFFIFKASEFNIANINQLFKAYGDFTLSDFIKEHLTIDEKYIVIDSAENLSDIEYQEIFQEFLSILLNNNWKIILTTRYSYLDDLKYQFLEVYKLSFKLINIEKLTTKKLRNYSKSYNFNLPENERLCKLIHIPFYLNEYLQNYRDLLDNTINYSDFKNILWNKQISKSSYRKNNTHIKRENCFLKIALKRANEGHFFVKGDDCESEVLSKLEKDEIIKYDSNAGGYFITHDIYEEWALDKVIERTFHGESDNKNFYQDIGSSLPVRRAFRNWLSEKLISNKNEVKSLIESTIKNNEIDSHWKDEILISVLLSDYSEIFFQLFETKLLENNHEFLTRVVFLLRTACKEIDESFLNSLGISKIEGISLNFLFTKPRGNGWDCGINFINKHKEKLGLKHINIILPLLNDWNDKNRQGKTTKNASQTALFYYDEITKNDGFGYRDERKNQIIKTVLNGSFEIKEELTTIFNEVVSKKEANYGSKYYELIQTVLSSSLDSSEIVKNLPEQVIELANLFWFQISDKTSRYSMGRDEIEQCFCLTSNHRDYYPASVFQTPIYQLLRFAPEQTIDFILSFTNKTVECYSNSRLKNEVQEVEVFIDETKSVKQYISHRLWDMYRGTQVSPYLLQSIHMALERWLLEKAKSESKEKLKSLCKYLIENSKSASISAIITSVALAQPSKMFSIAKILFQTKEFFFYDTRRLVLDQGQKSSLLMLSNFRTNYQDEIYEKERIETCDDKHRKMTLEHLAVNYQFFIGEKENEEEMKKKQKSLWAIFDKYYEQLPDKSKETDLDNTWRMYLARMDRRKMSPTVEEKKGQILISFNPEIDPELRKDSEEAIKPGLNAMKYTALKLWSNYRFQKNEVEYKKHQKYENNPQLVMTETKEIIEEIKNGIDENFSFFNRTISPYTCSVLIRDFFDKLDKEDAELCRKLIIEFASLPLLIENYSYQISDGTEPAIVTLPYLIKFFPENKEEAKSFLFLLLLNSYREILTFAVKSILHNLWEINFNDAHSIFLGYLLLKPKYEDLKKAIRKENYENNVYKISETQVLESFLEKYENEIEKVISDSVTYEDLPDLNKIDLNILKTAFELLPLKIENEDHKKFLNCILPIFSKKLFIDDDDEIDYTLKHSFWDKFAYIILNLKEEDIETYLKPFIDDFKISRDTARFFQAFITAEDTLNQYEAFWIVWNAFYTKIIEICKNEGSNYNINAIIHNYLLAWRYWKEEAKEWHTLKNREKLFFKKVAEDIGYHPAVLYSISKVLNDIGSNFIEDGIFWISNILQKNQPLYTKELERNTIYYIENIVKKYILNNRRKVKRSVRIKEQIMVILNFLFKRGSVTGYLLRENIL